MEQNAKKLLKTISEKVTTLTDKKISHVAYAPKYNEWRAYISQTKPFWEDITWRVKEPNIKGIAEFHLGFYSAKPDSRFKEIIDDVELLGKGKVNHFIKKDNGIRLVWSVNLNDSIQILELQNNVLEILTPFLDKVLKYVCTNDSEDIEFKSNEENNNINANNSESLSIPTSIPNIELDRILDYYYTNNNELPILLKLIIDKYGFDYRGIVFSESFDDIFHEIEKLMDTFPELINSINSYIENLKNSSLSDTEKWYEALKILADELNISGGKIIKTITPNGGSDNVFILFSNANEKYLIPLIILYHFNETLINAGGWFDEYFEDYDIEYDTFLDKNNSNLMSKSITTIEYSATQGPFGLSIDSNFRVLNITSDIYAASIIGIQSAKQFC